MIWQFAGKVCNEYFFVSIHNGLKLLRLKSKENLYGVSHRKERAGLQTCRLKPFFSLFFVTAGYGATGVFGGSSNIKTSSGERWRCLHTLKGHTGGDNS